jgi:hypothetical protein
MWAAVQACSARLVDGSVEGVVTALRSVQSKLFRAKRIKTALRAIEDLRTVGATADDAANGSSASEVIASLIDALREESEARRRDAKLVSRRCNGTAEEIEAAQRRIDLDLRRAATARFRAGCESLRLDDSRRIEIASGVSQDWELLIDAQAVLRREAVAVSAGRRVVSAI